MAWQAHIGTGTRAFNATGAFTCANTPTIHASTNITLSNGLISATYTAPSITNAVQGIAVYVVAKGTGGTVTFNFQEATVTKASTAAVNVTSLVTGQWNYIALTAPFTYTSVTANNCRWTTSTSGLTGTTSLAQASTVNFAFMGWDDLNSGSAPTGTNELWGLAPIGGTLTLTVTGTSQTCGSGLAPVTINTTREVNMANYFNTGVTLSWDTTASATLTTKGAAKFDVGSAEVRGTVGTPYPRAFTATWLLDQNGVGGTSGIMFVNGAPCTRQGAPKSSTTLWKTTFSSGLGTAASPLITTDAVDWDVGDEIVLAPTSNNATNYNETEYRFIITKNSTTSYVLSSTSGGAETALVNTHTGGYIFNLQRNVLTKSTVSTLANYQYFQSTTVDEVNIDWARDETMGIFFNSRDGMRLTNGTNNVASLDYSVCYNNRFSGYLFASSTVAQTHNGIIAAKQAAGVGSGNPSGMTVSSGSNRTFNDCVAIGSVGDGISVVGSSNTYNRCIGIGNNTAAATTTGGAMFVQGGSNTFNNCEFYANAYAAIIENADVNGTWNNCIFGTKGTNGTDVGVGTSTFNLSYYNTCTMSSTPLVINYLNAVPGSRISFQAYNSLNTNHITYTSYGSIRSTGAGLTDTNVRTAGTLNARIAAEDLTTGTTLSYLIPAIVGRAVQVLLFIQANSTFTGAATASGTVSLFLPGSTTADATATVSKADNNYNVVALSANYAGSNDAFATVTINAKTNTAGAYLYVADISNGTNTITALKPWSLGLPSPVMFEQLGDASAVWQVLTSTLTTTGTTGKQLTKLLTTAKYEGLQ